jgi:hypothetical protein
MINVSEHLTRRIFEDPGSAGWYKPTDGILLTKTLRGRVYKI